jgi:hypothetical protein
MAGNIRRIVSSSMLTLFALLSNTNSNNLVSASFNTVYNGVVRIELERKFINHIDNLQLDDRVDISLMIDAPVELDQDILLDDDEMNYSQLRELQRHRVRKEHIK